MTAWAQLNPSWDSAAANSTLCITSSSVMNVVVPTSRPAARRRPRTPSVFAKRGGLLGGARPHVQRAEETLLGAERAAHTAGRIGPRDFLVVELDGQVRAARAVPAVPAQFPVHRGDRLLRR